MSDKHPFRQRNADDVVRLVADNPLSRLFTTDRQGPFSTAVPVRPQLVEDRLHSLIGHVPRGSRVAESLAISPTALILIQGPNGYVSPSWFSDRKQAPTWNYTAAQFVVDANLVEDADFLERHLRDLTEAMERGRHRPWSIDELGPRYQQLAPRIVAFEARIRTADSRFKLGQDESDRTLSEILDGLQDGGNEGLISWMRTYGDER